ncbi:MAG: tetratricopeptide repeat protein [Burkholderiales bacterium]|nr:tetratricopeptide repeat protein [Burkholderiales bacterium]
MTSRHIASALALAAFLFAAASTPARADELQDIQALVKQGNHNQALDRVNSYLASRPKDAQGRFLKGVILTEQNKTGEAIKMFTALTEDYPELPEPYNNLAVLYASQQQYDKSRQALELAIQTHPSYATAHENLGDIYAKMASQAYDRALQLDKSNAAAQTKLSLIKEIFPVNSRHQRPSAKASVSAPAVQAAKPITPSPVTAPAPIAKPVEKIVEKATEKPVEKADKPKQDPTQAILGMVNNWAHAWSNKNVGEYLGYYAPDFKTPKGEPRAAWEKVRKERIQAPKNIQVSLSSVKITLKDETHASVTFRQTYKADTLNSATTKTLALVKSGDKWLIQQERVGA